MNVCSKYMKNTLPVTYKDIQGDLTLTQVTGKTNIVKKAKYRVISLLIG